MRRSRLVIVIAVVTALFLCMETAMVSAASLSQIRNDIKNKQNELSKSKSQEKNLSQQILELEKQINTKQADITKLENAIADAEVQIKVLEKELAEAEEKVETQTTNLNARLRNMYKNGSVGFVDVLLDSGSFSEFLTNLSLVEKVYTSDKDLLDELQRVYDEIDKKKQEIETAKTELTESKALAEEEKTSLEADKAAIDKKKAAVAADVDETERMLDELEREADRLNNEIKHEGSSSSNSSYTGGVMAWPAPSYTRVSSKFGWRTHPVTGRRKFHSGVDLAAPYGTAVVAANPGKVIKAGYSGGYGNRIVVDHGGGITTTYAHNSKLLVGVGTHVSRGQRIANIGSTGLSTGNHLHFEVRLNGNPVNPMNYIR